MGLNIAIMTGANVDSIRVRYEGLGVKDVFVGCAVKIKTYESFLEKYGLKADEVMYMGDDIPDLQVMQRVGCPVCPQDACTEVREGRDVVEQVLRAQGKWLMNEKAFGW